MWGIHREESLREKFPYPFNPTEIEEDSVEDYIDSDPEKDTKEA